MVLLVWWGFKLGKVGVNVVDVEIVWLCVEFDIVCEVICV